MWKCEHTELTSAAPAQVWKFYDPDEWTRWDHDLEWVKVDGPMADGATGVLKPVAGPKTKLRFVQVVEERTFVNVARLPLAKMTVGHHIEPAGDGSRITHRMTISGALAPLWGRVIGAKAAAGLPETMRRLTSLAEAGT
ncbi:MAG: SRPBCC family protein [Stackebrandtia sp.]